MRCCHLSRKFGASAFLLVLILFSLCSGAHADIKITTQVEMSFSGFVLASSSVHEYYRPNMTRSDGGNLSHPELDAVFSGVEESPTSFSITRYDKGLRWTIWDVDSSYSEVSLPDSEDIPDTSQSHSTDELRSLQESVIWSYSSTELSDSLIGGYPCQGLRITATELTSQSRMVIDVWTSRDYEWYRQFVDHEANRRLQEDQNPFQTAPLILAMAHQLGLDAKELRARASELQGITIKASLKIFGCLDLDAINQVGDLAEPVSESPPIAESPKDSYEQVFDFIDKPGTASVTVDSAALEDLKETLLAARADGAHSEFMAFAMEITEVDLAPLPDSLFELPEGYKKSR
jgi:hypothetical protein